MAHVGILISCFALRAFAESTESSTFLLFMIARLGGWHDVAVYKNIFPFAHCWNQKGLLCIAMLQGVV